MTSPTCPPSAEAYRLNLLYYRLLPDILPNGLPRLQRVLGEGGLRLGADFHLLARVTKNARGELCLEIDRRADDLVTRKETTLTLGLPLVRAIRTLLFQAHISSLAQRYAREARN